MKNFLNWLKNEESGQGMVEYGLIVLVVVVIIGAIAISFSDEIQNLFSGIGGKITDATTAAEGTPAT
jgi:pilus assembly protein Flp/PilA